MASSLGRITVLGIFRTFSIALVSPYIGLILYQRGMPILIVGIYYLLIAIGGAAGQLMGGMLSDRSGRKTTMVEGQSITGVMLFMMGVSLFFPGYVLLTIFGFLQIFFGSFAFSAYNTYVGDLGGNQEGLIKNYGTVRIGINLGWALGPLAGGLLMGILGYGYAFVISGLMIISSLFLFVGLNETEHDTKSFNLTAIKDTKYIYNISPFFIIFMFVAQFGLTLTVFETAVNNFTLIDLGLFYLVNGLTVVALQYPISRFLAKRNPISWIKVGIGLYMLGFIMLAFSRDLLSVMGSIFIITLGENVNSPLLMALANIMADPKKRGSYLGIYGVLTSSARSIGSSIGGTLMSNYLYQPFILWGIIDSLGITSILALRFITQKRLKK